jgi:outer membrane protein TolC
LDVTQGRYEQGMTIFLDVLSAQARYAQAITNQVKAFYDYKFAEKSMQKAVGELKIKE